MADKFDELTKALASARSRRDALKIFAAGAIGTAAALAGGASLALATPQGSSCEGPDGKSAGPCTPPTPVACCRGGFTGCCSKQQSCTNKGCI